MDLSPYVEQLRRELLAAAEVGGDEARALAERLTAPLEASLRLALLSALSTAAEEIKISLGSAFPAPDEPHAEIRGRDVSTGLPRNVTIGSGSPGTSSFIRNRLT